MSKSKLTVMFVSDSVSYLSNQTGTYFAKKGPNDARVTRIGKAAFESAQAAFEAETAQAESAQTESESVPASDPTPAVVEAAPVTVESVPASAPIEAETVQASVDPISSPVDAATRPDWDSMQTFERVTLEDLQAVPGIVARGLGIACMATLKVAAMGLGALAGLGIMGMRKVIAR